LVRDSHTETDNPKELSQAPMPKRGKANQGARPEPSPTVAVNKRDTSKRTRVRKKEGLKTRERRATHVIR